MVYLCRSEIVAKWTTDYIREKISTETVFVDGLRSPDELSVFEDNFKYIIVVYLHTDRFTRLKRLKDRGRDDEDSFTMKDLDERDSREEKWGLNQMKQYADYTIENDKSLEEFRSSIESVLQQLNYTN